jgi:hypothetical protein
VTAPVELIQARRNRYLSAAIDSLDGYHKALDVAAQAQAMLDGLTAPEAVPPELNPHTTGRLTDEWIDRTIDHTDAVARLERWRGVLLDVARDAKGNASGIYSQNVNHILAQLNNDLTGLLAEVSTIADELGGVSTPTQAIANDRGAQWKQLSGLSDDYALLRDAQRIVMAGQIDYVMSAKPIAGGEEHASDLYLANLDDLWPSWRKPGQVGQQVVNVDMSSHRYEPWPVDRTELMLWLATSDVEPWIPTTTELDELHAERRNRMNPNPRVLPGIRDVPINQAIRHPVHQITTTE